MAGIPDDLCSKLVLGGGGGQCLDSPERGPIVREKRPLKSGASLLPCTVIEMWGETVDFSDWHQTVWPRLGAVAERLWSPRQVNDPDAASQRMMAFRCLLNHRAVAVSCSDSAV